jgi:uncharacterized protein (DUF1800 family)
MGGRMSRNNNRRWGAIGCPTLFFAIAVLSGCGTFNSGNSTPGSSQSSLAVTPAAVQMRAGTQQQFSANLSSTTQSGSQSAGSSPTNAARSPIGGNRVLLASHPAGNTVATGSAALTWSVNGTAGGSGVVGTIDANGLYTAPAALPNPPTAQVTAATADGASISGSATIALENPVPVLISVSPSLVSVGNFNVAVNGSGFVSGAQVVFNGVMLSTTFVSSTQLTASGTATQAEIGNQQISVQNPDPGSVTSAGMIVQIEAAGVPVNAMAAARFLEQSTWGPTAQLIAHVEQVGFQDFLREQFSAAASAYSAPGPKDDMSFVQKRFFVNALQGQDQLRQRIASALSEIFVISDNKVSDPNAFVLWMNMLQKDAFGNYATVMKDVTISPAMGNYLDMANNDGCPSCAPNENYPREIMQLFTIGLSELNADGSVQLDGSGNPIPTYTQDTIEGFSHAYTGWTYPAQPGKTAQFWDSPYYSGPMIPFDKYHDEGSKLVLNGITLPGGGTTQGDLDAALQNIFNHPNVGPFVSKQLIQKLVAGDPSPDYVSRVSAIFNDNGSGVRGDLQAVVTAILMDTEARRGDDPTKVQATDGHLKEPLLHMMNLMRAMNATTNGTDNYSWSASQMGQEPFNPPTVFNFYPPDYIIPGTQIVAPEFKILNSSTTIARINFVNSLVYGNVGQNTKVDISPYSGAAADVNKLLDQVSGVMLHGQMSDSMRTTLVSTLSTITDTKRRTQAALYLVGSSSQFQVEH